MSTRHIVVILSLGSLFTFPSVSSAIVTLYAEGPASASVGAEISIQIKARITEPINALKTTVTIDPASVKFTEFDDSKSVISLWLQKGIPVAGGVVLEGAIPGGIAPAFTDSALIGTLRVQPTVETPIRISFSDAQVYLHQPTPTLSTVAIQDLTIPVQSASKAITPARTPPVVVESDIRIVRDSLLNDGRRTLVYHITTDRGTIDSVRIRERWFGLFGSWREITSPTALSDPLGLSILDVAFTDGQGGSPITSVIPALLKIVWSVIGVALLLTALWYRKKNRR